MRVNNPKIIGSFNRLNDEYDVLHQLVTVDQVQAMIETALGLDIPSSSMVPLYSLRKDPLSKYLYINQNGIGVSGITEAINHAIDEAKYYEGAGIYFDSGANDNMISIKLADDEPYLTTDNGVLASKNINTAISAAVSSVRNETIAIQPFKISTDQMETVGEPYQRSIILSGSISINVNFQRLSYDVPGYAINIINLNENQMIITDMTFLENGGTKIFIDLPWDTITNRVIIGWERNGNSLNKITGAYLFKVITLIQNNGEKINIKPVIDLTNINNG